LKVLFDQGTPVPLRQYLSAHDVRTAFELGWSRLQNGELIAAAENGGFDVLLTTDRNLRYQQNLRNRQISIVVLMSTSWPRIKHALGPIVQAIESVTPGSYSEVAIAP
jgi:hypothetical protein